MKWSWRFMRLAGIGIYVHATFPLLLIWVGFQEYLVRHRAEDAVAGIIFVLILFGIVVLHELGHALMARRFGIRTQDITLLPIGGVARLERIPEEPEQELAIAIAGPAVNVCIAIILFGVVALGGGLSAIHIASLGGGILIQLLRINLLLAGFNLLPAFPMGGGRVLRALLAMKLDYVRATDLAAKIGRGMAVLMFLFAWSPWGSPLLFLVALFVWIGGAREANMVRIRHELRGIMAGHFMLTDFRTLSPDEPLSRAVELLLSGLQLDFPVVENGRLVGWLSRPALIDGLARHGRGAVVSEAMSHQFPAVQPADSAESVSQRLRGTEGVSLPVVQDDAVIGIVTRDRLEEFIAIQTALRAPKGPPPNPPRLAERPAI